MTRAESEFSEYREGKRNQGWSKDEEFNSFGNLWKMGGVWLTNESGQFPGRGRGIGPGAGG